MAFANIIRRTASKALPLAIRVGGGSRKYNHHYSALFAAVNSSRDLSSKLLQRSLPSTLQHFSSRPASDESLLRVLQSEIQCAEETEGVDKVDEVPDNFPFKLEDNPGQQTVTLTRKYQDETITVEVGMSSLVTGDEDGDDNDDEKANQSQLPLVVRISKSRGPCLEFSCTAYPDEISIDSLSVKDQDHSEDLAYEGPDFLDLDENLQKAFHKYLEIRGIKPSATNFLHEYMVNKDGREYLMWLKNLKKFVEV